MSALVLTNMAGYIWSIPLDETGINVQKVTVKTSSTKYLLPDKGANIIGRADYNFQQEYDIEGFLTGSPTAAPGLIFVVANLISTNGVTAGPVILDDDTITYEPGKPGHVAYKATRYGSMPATPTQTVT